MAQTRKQKIKVKPNAVSPKVDPNVLLADFGLQHQDVVRFRRIAGGNWTSATVDGVNRDGSLSLFDGSGRFRAIHAELCEVRRHGPRGGTTWEQVKKNE